MEEIAIVFTADATNTTEIIKTYPGLKQRFCNIITNEELKLDKTILSRFNAIIDCTTGNKLYNDFLDKKRGVKFNESLEYLKTPNGKFLIKGPNIFQLTAPRFSNSDETMKKFEDDMENYKTVINFILMKIPRTRSILNTEAGLKGGGIVINDVIEKDINKKVYKLVRKVPEFLEPNVEYITLEDVELLKELSKLKQVIQ